MQYAEKIRYLQEQGGRNRIKDELTHLKTDQLNAMLPEAQAQFTQLLTIHITFYLPLQNCKVLQFLLVFHKQVLCFSAIFMKEWQHIKLYWSKNKRPKN